MIHGYADNEYVEQIISLYKDIIASRVKYDGVTFVAILTPCRHSWLVDAGVEIFNSMEHDHEVKPVLIILLAWLTV